MGEKRKQKAEGADFVGSTIQSRGNFQDRSMKSTAKADKVEKDSRFNEKYHTGRVVSSGAGFPVYEEKEGARAKPISKARIAFEKGKRR
jgi:hypothetical protein